MSIVIEYKELGELTELLGIEQSYSALESYFEDFNNDMFLNIYTKLKEKVGVQKAIELLNITINMTNFKVDKELSDELLLDENLQELVINSKEKNNLLINILKENIESVVVEEDLSSTSKDDLYTEEEEKEAFEKYDDLRKNLENYLRFFHKDFVSYIEANIKQKQDESKTELKDSFITIVLSKLYSYTNNEELVVELLKDENVVSMVDELREQRDDIAKHNYRLVTSIAKTYLDLGLSKDDLEQEGKFGLLRSIEKFDVKTGNKFSTYSTWWINQAIRRGLANNGTTIRIPVHQYEKMMRIRRAERILRMQDGIEEPTDKELYDKCVELGYDLTVDQIKENRKIDQLKRLTSVDRNVGEDEDTALIDFIASDNHETPEVFAENRDINDRINYVLDHLAFYTKKGKNEHDTILVFKQLSFLTNDNKDINIILTLKEYDELMKQMRLGDKKEAFMAFLNKYKINPDSLTSSLCVSDLKMTPQEREVLIFRYRLGLNNEFSYRFLSRRNYNGVFFEEATDEEGEVDITLDKAGKLFGITRERVRQIENKARKKVEIALKKKKSAPVITLQVHRGESFNAYSRLGISNTNNEYVLKLFKNPDDLDIISVDRLGNVRTINEGMADIELKNIVSGITRRLHIVVVEPLKISINHYVDEKRKLKLSLENNNKKDSQ